MKIATMLGHSFTVIAPSEHNVPNKWALIRKYHLADECASVRAPKPRRDRDRRGEAHRGRAPRASPNTWREVLVHGCAGFAELVQAHGAELGVPVLDGVVCALNVATGLVK
jgi:allantoin racemase